MPHNSPSVLVIRLDAIGDALALTPLLAALRDRSIPVDLVLRDVNAHVFSSRAARTTYIAPFDLRSSTNSNLRAIRAFGARMQENRYSHVLVATEDPGGYRLAHAVGAKHRIGFSNGWGKPFKSLWIRSLVNETVVRSAGLDPRAPHECAVIFELGRGLLGRTAVPTRDPAHLRPLVLEREPARRPVIAFQVSDKWERLGIDLDSVVAALHATATAGDAHAIASERETDYARRVESASGIRVERYATLEPWKEAIAEARALVTPDSGALHVGGMVGTPTVAIFPPAADFALQSARWAPWAAAHRMLEATGDWPSDVAAALRTLL